MLLTEPYYLFAFNLLIGLILGSVFFRSDYCMAGMFRDVFLLKNYSLLPSLSLLIVVSMVLFYLAKAAGFIILYPPPNYSYPSLATLIGGIVFGIGMVLAGGCVVSTLYKMGGGNLTNLIAFIGIIAGSMLYAESHPLWESFRAATVITPHVLLSELTPKGEPVVILVIALISLTLFIRWKRQGKWTLTVYAEGYLQPWKAAVIIAGLNAAVYVISGWPMGITTAYAKIGAYIESFLVPSHAAKLVYFTQDSVTAQLSAAVISGGAGPKVDIVSFTELALVVGVIAGSFLTAIFLKEFKVYGLPPKRQALSSVIGGMLLAYGARIASGCNLKFIVGALPLLALQSVAFAAGIIAGAGIGTVILKKLVIKV